MALSCASAGAFGGWLMPALNAARPLPPPPVIEVITDQPPTAVPVVARAGNLVLRLVNPGPSSERLELVQLDRWRSLGDPFNLGAGAVTHLPVQLVAGDYAVLRVGQGAGSEKPGLMQRIRVQ